jgi:hypothetical protein
MSKISPVWSTDCWENLPIVDRLRLEDIKKKNTMKDTSLQGDMEGKGRHPGNMELSRRFQKSMLAMGKYQ